MKKMVIFILTISFCSISSATEIEEITFKDKVKNYYETVCENFKASMPDLNKENLKIAAITTTGVATVAITGYGIPKYLKKRDSEKKS